MLSTTSLSLRGAQLLFHSPPGGLWLREQKALQSPREVRGQGSQKFPRGVPGAGAWEEEAVQVQVQRHLGPLGRTQVEVSEQGFIQDLGRETAAF